MLYYNHIKEVQSNGKVNLTALMKGRAEHKGIRKGARRDERQSDPSDESQCVVTEIKVTHHSPFA